MVKCILCGEPIENHAPDIHTLKIDDRRTVDICDTCRQKFTQWQREKLAKLFPTRTTKRYFANND